MTPGERASRAQLQASDPRVSAFVAASAGSGKTKLLTDRLLRLMLSGTAPPQGILCLTFTRAAAAEMAVRLQGRLAQWARAPDEGLAAALRELGIAPSPAICAEARRLLARVLDLPGGMRIATVHAFCQSLLRRFPIEAALSPRFRLAEETRVAASLGIEAERLLAEAGGAALARRVAPRMGLGAFLDLAGALIAEPEALAAATAEGAVALEAALRRRLGAAEDVAAARAAMLTGMDAKALRKAAAGVEGGKDALRYAGAIRDWLKAPHDVETWRDCIIGSDGGARRFRLKRDTTTATQDAFLDAVAAEAERLLRLEDAIAAHEVAAVSAALAGLAAPMSRRYAATKEAAGLLDYADLIARTQGLLRDPGAAWVRYKLDGGLDHLLLDEVQDTSPAQWEIAEKLTEEFFAGLGTQGPGRTIFAVGDRKQSIFSFQGAAPEAFDGQAQRLHGIAGEAFREVALDVSFRSAAPVLELVDAVFAGGDVADGVAAPGTLHHDTARVGEAGRVELWPLAEARGADAAQPWAIARENRSAQGAPQRLASLLGAWIAAATDPRHGVMLEARGRRLRPGDIMLLVRRRSAFERALVRDLKARGVAVAGLDRMALVEQPAVADVLVLLDALLLPEDDLAFATYLTSPLGGCDDDDLIALAPLRRGTLHAELAARQGERAHWHAAFERFAQLFRRVDLLSPHALIAHALGPLGGRARLLARFGADAAEPLDELLAMALEHAAEEPPSLAGFLAWLRSSTAEIKREASAGGDAVRILTIHGAKGLQAPLVILADTTSKPPREAGLRWLDDGAGRRLPVYAPGGGLACDAAREEAAAAAQAARRERNRLLYVALTRAEDRLIVCGWKGSRNPPDDCWYRAVEAGFDRLEARNEPIGEGWDRPARVIEAAQEKKVPKAASTALEAAPRLPRWAGVAPDWLATPPAPEDAVAALVPSRPEGAAFGAPPAATSPLATPRAARGRARGQALHALLQHLPTLPQEAREAAARRFLEAPAQGFSAAEASAALAEVVAVMAHPALAPAFGPESRAEVPLTGCVAGMIVGGVVDRIAIAGEEVVILDYKTDRAPPRSAEAAPVAYLRQMAAYRAVVGEALPGRRLRCVLVWTVGAVVMELPCALLDRFAPAAA